MMMIYCHHTAPASGASRYNYISSKDKIYSVMSRNKQLRLERPISEMNRLLTEKLTNTKSVYSTRNFDKVHYTARENQLDTMFLVRKKKLLDICKENKLIFEKIYTQKSVYPKEHFDQSYETNKIISERLLKGKLRERKAVVGDDRDRDNRQVTNTRCTSQKTWRTFENNSNRVLPTLEDRTMAFFNDIYNLPPPDPNRISRTVAVSSSSRATRQAKQGKSFRIRDFVMF